MLLMKLNITEKTATGVHHTTVEAFMRSVRLCSSVASATGVLPDAVAWADCLSVSKAREQPPPFSASTCSTVLARETKNTSPPPAGAW